MLTRASALGLAAICFLPLRSEPQHDWSFLRLRNQLGNRALQGEIALGSHRFGRGLRRWWLKLTK